MTNLKDPLSDLVREVPRHVVPDDLARTAWAAGRRRRWRRRTAVTGAAAAVLALLGPTVTSTSGWVGSVGPAGSEGGPVVEGYPERIGHQWWVRDLPDAPGPLAGVMGRSTDDGPPSTREYVVAFSASGHQWRIPSEQSSYANRPTLSDTGRYLAYFPHARSGPFVIHDLVSGDKTVLEEVTPHMGPHNRPYTVHVQTPAFWSPDDSRVVLFSAGGPPRSALLVTTDGHVRRVEGQGSLVGWVDADHLAWRDSTERPDGTVTGVSITVTDTAGQVVRTVDLDLPGVIRDGLDQWSAVLSPDGDDVALLAGGASGDAVLHRYSLEDGSAVIEPMPLFVPGLDEVCQLGWAGSRLVVPTHPDSSSGALATLAQRGVPPLVVADPLGDTECLTLAARAAAGEPHGGLFGTTAWWWTWWWREVLLAGAAVSALMWLARLLRRRRPAPVSWRDAHHAA